MSARFGEYEVLEALPGGAFHARSKAGLEVRITPHPPRVPLPPLPPPHPHVAEVLEFQLELVVSGWVPGVTLGELVARAHRRGLSALPAFLSVSLVQQICRGLQHAHQHGAPVPGAVSLESVVVGFDGRARVTCFGDAALDVPAAALVLDRLLGESVDAELIRIIAEAREPEAMRRVPTALSLEQRLGHWQVKQRQLFPRLELVSELVAWLYPGEARRETGEAFAAWMDTECTGPVRPEPPPRPRGLPVATRPPSLRRMRVGLLTLLGLLVGTLLGVHSLLLKRELQPPQPSVEPPSMAVLIPAAPAAAEPSQVKMVAVAEEPVPNMSRRAEGAPAQVLLSSKVHGVELETAGFAVQAPTSRWAARTVPMRPRRQLPSYASLYVAEFDESSRLQRLTQLGPTWLTLSQPSARFFAMQTDQPADDGSFGIALATVSVGVIAPDPRLERPDVLTDSMTTLEYRRFVLGGLNPSKRYVVTLRENRGPTPPVIATATIPRAAVRSRTGSGFQQRGAPLDQVLLQPSVPVTVKDASRLSFVVLTTRGAPELRATVDVNPASAGRRPASDASMTEGLIHDGKELLKRHEYRSAALVFEQCVQMDPTDFECQRLRATALAAGRPAVHP